MYRFLLAAALLSLTIPSRAQTAPLPPGVTRQPVQFSGGHDTDPRDRGRPVILVASALGVTSDVFRDAFSHVHPADPAVGPTGDEARKNKQALLGALSKYGVTNDRLDQVSNYYRYVRSRGEMWTNRPAVANALVKDGAIVGYEVIDPGAGYSSAPAVTVPSMSGAHPRAELKFSTDLHTNGSISKISDQPAK